MNAASRPAVAPLDHLTEGQLDRVRRRPLRGGRRRTGRRVPARRPAARRPGQRQPAARAGGGARPGRGRGHRRRRRVRRARRRAPTTQITRFFDAFADRLADPASSAPIVEANGADVERARAARALHDPPRARRRRCSTAWWPACAAGPAATCGATPCVHTVEHDGWTVEARRAPLGVVGFVFEGRPNVFADAAGVVRTGNTVVFRIGSDALGTAQAIVDARAAPGARRGRPARRRGEPRRVGRARGGLGAVRRRPPVAGRGPRVGPGGGPARQRRPPGRRAGEPARHRRRMDRGRARRRRRTVPRRSRATRSTARCATR